MIRGLAEFVKEVLWPSVTRWNDTGSHIHSTATQKIRTIVHDVGFLAKFFY
jgi:hypothetical protein